MAEKAEVKRIVTEEFTAVWTHLFKPHAFKGDTDKARYSVEMLFDPDDVDEMVEAAKEVARLNFPDEPLKDIKFPFKKGDALAEKAKKKERDGEYYRGKIMVRAHSKEPPAICDLQYNYIIDPNKVHAGCKGRAEITFAPYENDLTGKGITVYLNSYQHTAAGERIGGRDMKKIFGSYRAETDDDPEVEDIF